MNHKELFADGLLMRIPMAAITMGINLAMEHVPEQYVVGHQAFKRLHTWIFSGKGKDKLMVLRFTLHDEVERARKLFVAWSDAREKQPPAINQLDDRKGKKKNKQSEGEGMQPLYGYMALRALECAVNAAIGGDTAELVDLLECLDAVPCVAGADPGKVESLTAVLQSLNDIFDQRNWKAIVEAA
jgi:hypothetical protein